MHIRNNSTSGAQPHPRKDDAADKDIGKALRKGVEPTQPSENEKRADAATQRNAREARGPRDSFERSRPQEDAGVDVSDRLKQARAQARENRIANARSKHTQEQHAGRVQNARLKHTAASQADEARDQRIAAARAKAATPTDTRNGAVESKEPTNAQRIENARESRQDRIDGARVMHTEQQIASRAADALSKHTGDGDPVARARANFGNLSRESVQLSGGTQARADHVQDVHGRQETVEARAERVESLKHEYETNMLNTVDRARAAAGRMLGGDV